MSTVPRDTVSSRAAMGRVKMASGIDDLSYHWEFHDEGRALARRTLHVDLACMLLDDPVGHRKPQPGAAAVPGLGLVLGGEERIVDAMNVFLGDATSGVRHRDLDVVSIAGGDGERAS